MYIYIYRYGTSQSLTDFIETVFIIASRKHSNVKSPEIPLLIYRFNRKRVSAHTADIGSPADIACPLNYIFFLSYSLNRPFTFLKDNACTVAHALLLKWIRSTTKRTGGDSVCAWLNNSHQKGTHFSVVSHQVYIRPSAFLYIFDLWITQTHRRKKLPKLLTSVYTCTPKTKKNVCVYWRYTQLHEIIFN